MTTSPSVQLITNATVAQYIHEISVRHRPRDPEWARRGDHAGADQAAANRRARRRLELVEAGPGSARG